MSWNTPQRQWLFWLRVTKWECLKVKIPRITRTHILTYIHKTVAVDQSGVIRRFRARLNLFPLREVRSGGSWLCSAGALQQKRHFPASVLDRGTLNSPLCLVIRSRISAFKRRAAASESGSPFSITLCVRHSVLNSTSCRASSQPSFSRRSVAWSYFLRPKMTLAAKLSIFWTRAKFCFEPLP